MKIQRREVSLSDPLKGELNLKDESRSWNKKNSLRGHSGKRMGSSVRAGKAGLGRRRGLNAFQRTNQQDQVIV